MPGAHPYKKEDLIPILKAFDGKEATRNRALFAVGCGTGFRIQELLTLKRRDVINKYGNIRGRITVLHTKGKRSRSVVLNDFARPFLMDWLLEQQNRGFRKDINWLWTMWNGRRMYYRAFLRVLKAATEKCNLIDGKYTTHSMRKTFAMHTYMYYHEQRMSGVLIDPLVKTQEALGHDSIESTRSYLQFMLGNTDDSTKQLYTDISSEILQNFNFFSR